MSEQPATLPFQNSESKTVGLTGGAIGVIRENAPRIVAGLKLAMDISVASSGDPFLIAYAAFAGTGRIISLLYGSKENQRQLVEEARLHSEEAPGTIGKVLSPRKYPVESSAGLSTIAEMFTIGFGIEQFAVGSTGYTYVALGAIAVWSYANILFGKEKMATKEKPSDALRFAESESKQMGIIDRIKHFADENPVLISSVVQFTVCLGLLVGSIMEGKPMGLRVAGAVGLVSTAIQALFVRKNEFNIEGAQAQAAGQPGGRVETPSFQQGGFNVGVQPA